MSNKHWNFRIHSCSTALSLNSLSTIKFCVKTEKTIETVKKLATFLGK